MQCKLGFFETSELKDPPVETLALQVSGLPWQATVCCVVTLPFYNFEISNVLFSLKPRHAQRKEWRICLCTCVTCSRPFHKSFELPSAHPLGRKRPRPTKAAQKNALTLQPTDVHSLSLSVCLFAAAFLGDIALDEEDLRSFRVDRIIDLAQRTVQTVNHTDTGNNVASIGQSIFAMCMSVEYVFREGSHSVSRRHSEALKKWLKCENRSKAKKTKWQNWVSVHFYYSIVGSMLLTCEICKSKICKAKFYTLDLFLSKLKWSSHFTRILFDCQHLLHTSTGFVTSCLYTLQVSRNYNTCAVGSKGNSQVFPG